MSDTGSAPDGARLVVHCKRDPYDVYVGRPSKWGNPFSHKAGTQAIYRVQSREEAVAAYAVWLEGNRELLADLHELRGKVLGCWCAPQACHGEVLARRAAALPPYPLECRHPERCAGLASCPRDKSCID